jgi:hypothetical protein
MSDTGRRRTELQAKARRDAAARARRLAMSVTQDDDRAQLLDYATTLDNEADSLERQASTSTHKQQQQPQQQAQQQAQQQEATEPAPTKPANGKKPRG